jgi:SPP1 gp7 family putative phage head morphogenesis protein
MPAKIRKSKKLRPIHPNVTLERRLKKEILWQIYQIVFAPISKFDESLPAVKNSSNYSALHAALMSGEISYVEDHFEGKFNAAISKDLKSLGAERIKTGWRIKRENLPSQVNIGIANAEAKFAKISQRIIAALRPENMKKTAGEITKIFAKQYHQELKRLDKVLENNVPSARRAALAIDAEFTPKIKEKIANDYAANLEYYVTDFSAKETEKLRQLVEENFAKGARADDLKKIIVQRFGVSERKADFLAKQETSLLTSTYTFARYQDIGIDKYQWSTSHDARVRHDHRILDGKIFKFSKPPIVDVATGRRANPGEDFNCRCVAIPIIE